MRVHCDKPGERELRAVFSFDPAEVRLDETLIGVVVQLRDCATAGEPGSPALPKRNVRLALPPRTRMTGMDVRAIATTTISRDAVPVAPLQFTRAGEYNAVGRELQVEPFPMPAFVPANPVLYAEAM